MVKHTFVCLVAATLLLVGGCSSTSTPTDSDERERVDSRSAARADSTTGRQFVQRAESGTIRTEGGRTVLTLKDVDPVMHWSQQRPVLDLGVEPTAWFVRHWAQRGLESNPPSAVLHLTGSDEGKYPMELASPIYNGKKKTVRYEVIPLGSGLKPLPDEFGEAKLFIDAVAELDHQPVRITVQGAKAGDTVRVLLSSPGDRVAWSMGRALRSSSTTGGLEFDPESHPIAIEQLQISNSDVLITLGGEPDGRRMNFGLRLMLTAEFNVEEFSLRSDSDPGLATRVAVGTQPTTELGVEPTTFPWGVDFAD